MPEPAAVAAAAARVPEPAAAGGARACAGGGARACADGGACAFDVRILTGLPLFQRPLSRRKLALRPLVAIQPVR